MKRGNFVFAAIIVSTLFTSCINASQEESNTRADMKITKELFGQVDSTDVYLFTLKNANGMVVKIPNYGGIVTSVLVPDRDGNMADVVLGFDELQAYLDGHPYFGCIVGRYGNRIANGRFTLDGKEYILAQNNGPNHLHGGINGFDKKIWEAESEQKDDTVSLILHYNSPDGEEGYPGTLATEVIYSLTNDNELVIKYSAGTDKPTPVNLTHHSYFNLSGGQESILDHVLTIAADKYVVVNENLIPTGELRELKGSAMDFSTPHSIGERIDEVEGGYDHTYVLNNMSKLMKVADFYHPASGRAVEVYTDEPGIQFYSGNFLDGSLTGKNGIIYEKHHGFCLETQHFPDSPNQEGFPSTILRPGDEYGYTSIYKFTVKED
ncbi:MAG: aldose epimerase family protein [Bacteroidales bacterium]|jgi:aldose 1-epimerase|nr:aldose epimerase family protein [Bacteroidales bacterium]